MAGGALGNAGALDGASHGSLDSRYLKMMPSCHPRRAATRSLRRKRVPPTPVPVRTRILSKQRVTQASRRNSRTLIAVVLCPALAAKSFQRGHARLCQWRPTILPAFTTSHDDLTPLHVDILHSKRRTFGNPQATAIHQQGTALRAPKLAERSHVSLSR